MQLQQTTRMKLQERNYKHVITSVFRSRSNHPAAPTPTDSHKTQSFQRFLSFFWGVLGRLVGLQSAIANVFSAMEFRIPAAAGCYIHRRVCLDRLGILRHLFWMAVRIPKSPPLKEGGRCEVSLWSSDLAGLPPIVSPTVWGVSRELFSSFSLLPA